MPNRQHIINIRRLDVENGRQNNYTSKQPRLGLLRPCEITAALCAGDLPLTVLHLHPLRSLDALLLKAETSIKRRPRDTL